MLPGLPKFRAGNAPDRIWSDGRYVNSRLAVYYGAKAATQSKAGVLAPPRVHTGLAAPSRG